MKTTRTTQQLRDLLDSARDQDKKIGFVPTMGALHAGHMSLIQMAKEQTDLVVASVFVNPTQFNNPQDLEKYPRTPESDAQLLEEHGCDIVFFPSVDEMYPPGKEAVKVDLGNLATVMEGEFRPGHFDGVVDVVSRFFDIVRPDKAFFGQKDFQQLAVIRKMVKVLNMPVEVISGPTSREESGLARSSRNMRLTGEQKEEALLIYKTLLYAKSIAKIHSPREVVLNASQQFVHSGLKLEYFAVVDPHTLQHLTGDWVDGAVACVAAFCGDVRLIDNMIIRD